VVLFGRGRLLMMSMAEAAGFARWGFLGFFLTLIATRAVPGYFWLRNHHSYAVNGTWVFLVEVAGWMAELRRTTKVG
jgi:hypothetical protein